MDKWTISKYTAMAFDGTLIFWPFKKAKCGIYRVIEDPYVFVNTFRILDCDLSP